MSALTIRTGRELVRNSVSENTNRAYARTIRQLTEWLTEHGRDLEDASIADYLHEMFHAGRAPQTAAQVVAALNFTARRADEPSPVGRLTADTLDEIRRQGIGRGRGQAHGVQWEDADRIAENAARDGLVGLRDAAVIAVASDAMLRVSEIAAIHVEHVDDRGTLLIPRSKTDPYGHGATQYLGAATVERIRRWRGAGSVHAGPLFRAIYRDIVQSGPLSAKTITRIIQRRARECGLEEGVSGHSLRVGSAQSLAASGATLVEMQVEGRWRSTRMPAHYAQAEIASRGATARLRYGRG